MYMYLYQYHDVIVFSKLTLSHQSFLNEYNYAWDLLSFQNSVVCNISWDRRDDQAYTCK